MDVYLVPYQLFARKILDIYTELRNTNNIFQLVFLDEVLHRCIYHLKIKSRTFYNILLQSRGTWPLYR